ncbi:MAG: VIT1/CCC1 transporter family protein [Betaproteobacteria bacterium]|nr:VIT1/CCC1 transporter family protein [Betaproteobacteria bacterium]
MRRFTPKHLTIRWLLARLPRWLKAAHKPGSRANRRGHPWPTSAAQVGRGHPGLTTSSNLRAAVFGINDGLVSNTSLIMGVAGATGSTHLVAVSGVAGLLAGAFSMAAGEFVSMSSQREFFERQIREEQEELERFPRQETEEMALIYQSRGIPLSEARKISEILMRDPQSALQAHVREELGLNPADLGSPLGAAVSSFTSFAAGALVPLIPYLLPLHGEAAPAGVAVASSVALFTIGALINALSGQAPLRGGFRMLGIGVAAAAITYGIGALLGVSLS